MNTSGQLIDELSGGNGFMVTLTITDTPGQPDGNGGTTPGSVQTEYQVSSNDYAFAATYSITNQADDGSGSTGGDTTQQTFDPTLSNYGLPFFDASSASTSAKANVEETLIGGGYGDLATFNSSSNTPDQNWTIAVNKKGDAVFSGNASTGFTGTVALTQGEQVAYTDPNTGEQSTKASPVIVGVELGQQVYGLEVIPDSGLQDGFAEPDSASQTVVAEGTSTSVINLTYNDYYWHVNGRNDQITLGGGSNSEFYFSGPASSYRLSYDGTGDLKVTGGATGATLFMMGGGDGEINFSDGTTIGLGGNYSSGIDDTAMYGEQGALFELSGGTQLVEAGLVSGQATGIAIFQTGGDIPDLGWTITETVNPNKADANKLLVTFDGTNAGYDGVATLGGISDVQLNDQYYRLEEVAKAKTLDLTDAADADAYLVVDNGDARLVFANTGNAYWHVGGTGDIATLGISAAYGFGGVTTAYFAGSLSQYTIRNTKTQVTVTGGTTGTTKFLLQGGSGELTFGDGSTVAIGAATPASAPAASPDLETQHALLAQAMATYSGDKRGFTQTLVQTSQSDTISPQLATSLHG